MKTLYYDCFAGISGDMNLAALIDIGADVGRLESELKKLNIDGWSLKISEATRGGISGTCLKVCCKDEPHAHAHNNIAEHSHGHDGHAKSHSEHSHAHMHEHRSFAQIREIIEKSPLSEYVKKNSIAIFRTLAEAEAKVHGKSVDDVHFHEVGATDSIIDIVGAAVCAEILGVDNFAASSVELGGGTVRCQHGVMPVPAPATAIIAEKFPVKLGGAPHECTTPTGAAIIATLCGSYNPKISGKIAATGIGVGHRDCKELPNVLRVMLIESGENAAENHLKTEQMSVISANIDDMTAEALSLFAEKLFVAGAADAWQESIAMKKGRMAAKVCALVHDDKFDAVQSCFFKNSTTLGVRVQNICRRSIGRKSVSAQTEYGEVRFKVSEFDGQTRVKPEFEDIGRISREKNIPMDLLEKRLIAEYLK